MDVVIAQFGQIRNSHRHPTPVPTGTEATASIGAATLHLDVERATGRVLAVGVGAHVHGADRFVVNSADKHRQLRSDR